MLLLILIAGSVWIMYHLNTNMMPGMTPAEAAARRDAARGKRRLLLTALCAARALLFAALGVWQVERLAWKLDLIARVEARVRAPPVAAAAPAHWPSSTPGRSNIAMSR